MAQRRQELAEGIAEISVAMESIRLVLESAQISETELRLAIKGRPPSVEVMKRGLPSAELAVRSETSKWLLGLMSQSPVVFDLAGVRAVRGLWWTLRLRLAA